MLDFLLGVFFVGLLLRGWSRGFVREAMDLVGVLAGVALAFRFSGAAGTVVNGIFGTSPVPSRLIGGVALFLIVGGTAAVLAHYLHRVASLPGLRLSNRLTGAGLALAGGLFVATLVLSLASLVSLPTAVASQVSDSAVAQALTRPGGVSQRVFTRVAGDEIVEVLLRLDELVGGSQVILEPGQIITFTPVSTEEVGDAEAAARRLFRKLNHIRQEEGIADLRWSRPLAEVALGHAFDMYTGGFVGHVTPAGGTLAGRLADAGLNPARAGENLALTADAAEAHAGLIASEGHRATMLDAGYRQVGVAAVDGPLGLMVVQVFGSG